MPGIVGGLLMVGAFAAVAAAAGFVAVRLYRVSRWAQPGGAGPAGEPPDA